MHDGFVYCILCAIKNHILKWAGLCGLAGVLSGCACLGRGAAARELFNGRDLANWYTFIRGRGVSLWGKIL